MIWLSWCANLPYTMFGIAVGLISIPRSVHIEYVLEVPVVVLHVRTLRWMFLFPRVRGVTFANTVLIGPLATPTVLSHELVHVEQFLKRPVVFPLAYWWELVWNGYRGNRFEVEAYSREVGYDDENHG